MTKQKTKETSYEDVVDIVDKDQYDAMLFNRLLLKAKIKNAKTILEQEFMTTILCLYERGDLDITRDPSTGELLYKATELN
jgi:hypothetical protein